MYVAKLDHKYFEKLDFQPNFVQGPNDAICAGSKSCAYDLRLVWKEQIECYIITNIIEYSRINIELAMTLS